MSSRKGKSDLPPILKIEPAKSPRDRGTMMKLLYDDWKEKDGKWGTQYMRSVEVNGERHTFFTSESLHNMIVETGAGKGDFLEILRTGEGTDTRWYVYLIDEDGNEITTPQQRVREADGDGERRAPAKPRMSYEARVTAFLARENLYAASLVRAMKLLPYLAKQAGAEPSEPRFDANAMGYTIYRMADELDIELDANGDPLMEIPDEGSEADSGGDSDEPDIDEDPADRDLTGAQQKRRDALMEAARALPHDDGEPATEDDVLDIATAVLELERTLTWKDLSDKDARTVLRFLKGQSSLGDAMKESGAAPF
jgi:hypothetical protein